MNENDKTSIIRSIARLAKTEEEVHDLIAILAEQDWAYCIKRERYVTPTGRLKDLPCVICKEMYPCGDGPGCGICRDCWHPHEGWKITVRLHSNRTRARNLGLPCTLTLREWYDTLDHFNHLCAYCEKANHTATEHFIPLVLGGGTTRGNCVPACAACNRKKNNHLPQDVADRFPEGAIDRISLYLSQF